MRLIVFLSRTTVYVVISKHEGHTLRYISRFFSSFTRFILIANIRCFRTSTFIPPFLQENWRIIFLSGRKEKISRKLINFIFSGLPDLSGIPNYRDFPTSKKIINYPDFSTSQRFPTIGTSRPLKDSQLSGLLDLPEIVNYRDFSTSQWSQMSRLPDL